MNLTDVSIHPPADLRRVGIGYLDRTRVMSDAIRVDREPGVALEIEERTLGLRVPRAAAGFSAGMLERSIGRMAFDDRIG